MTSLRSRLFSSPLEGRERHFAAFPPSWRDNPRGNVVGGLLAAIVTLPASTQPPSSAWSRS